MSIIHINRPQTLRELNRIEIKKQHCKKRNIYNEKALEMKDYGGEWSVKNPYFQ